MRLSSIVRRSASASAAGAPRRASSRSSSGTRRSLADGARALAEGRLDAYASNKAILHQMADGLPGSRVLPGSWGEESIAFGVPKGRPTALPYLEAFVKKAREEGLVRRAADRAGVRGLAGGGSG